MKNRRAKIYLIGAGPGDPELLTIKGLKLIRKAKVILYDALSNDELLKYAPSSALKIYVGKRAGQHSLKQEEINLLLVQTALEHDEVIRLKGGDPFIFGRGYEELEYATAFNIEVEVVPGISSSMALPALQKVPLTHRGWSRGFWVLTATTKESKLTAELVLAAQSDSTTVILMGMRKLPQIVKLYQQEGRGNLAVMIVQNGSLPHEKIALGTIDSIEAVVREKELGTPAIIVIGAVVGLHEEATALKNLITATQVA